MNVASMTERLRRYRRTTLDIYEQSGSALYTGRYIANIGAAKLPMLARHVLQLRRRRDIATAVAEIRGEPGGLPVLGIKATGGLGDFVVMARFMRDLVGTSEDFLFDVYASVPSQADWVFSGIPGFRAVFADSLFDHMSREYDLGLSMNQFVIVHQDRTDWRKLRSCPRLMSLCGSIIRYRPKIDVFVQHHPHLDNGLARKAVYANASRRDFLHAIARIPYGGDQMEIRCAEAAIDDFGLAGTPYITVHNGFDTGFPIVSAKATKCYPHFDAVIRELKRELPHLTVVQVGTSTSDGLASADRNLIGSTTLPEVAALLRGARLHLDNEGGLVHLARCFGTRSCVIFGPTPSDYFGYPNNINIDPPYCGGCWWVETSWMDRCGRGFAVPPCMDWQHPSTVAARIRDVLAPPLAEALAESRVVTLPLRRDGAAAERPLSA